MVDEPPRPGFLTGGLPGIVSGATKHRQKKAFSVPRKFSGGKKSLFAPPDYFLTPEKAFFQVRKIFPRRKKPFSPVGNISAPAKSLFLSPEIFPEPEKVFFCLRKIFRPQKNPFFDDKFSPTAIRQPDTPFDWVEVTNDRVRFEAFA